MKKLLSLSLGILTAFGGFVDIGDLVTNALVGARFGMALAWVMLVGTIGICVFAEMSGRVVAVCGRGSFDLIRERLGPRIGLLNLFASMAVTVLTFIAEIGGVALSLALATDVNRYLWMPIAGIAVWLVLWRAKFSVIENGFGLIGIALITFAIAVWKLSPDWGSLWHQSTHPHVPFGEGHPTYWYYAIALFGAVLSPYEVFFFSSGGVEEHWSPKSLPTMRANVLIGFPLGGALALAITTCAALVLEPAGIQVDTLSQVGLPIAVALGKLGLAITLLGFFAVTFGASCETGLSVGYSIGQYFGFQWGKYARPKQAPLFHLAMLATVLIAVPVLLTTVDPIKVTEYAVVFAAIALPLTYFPILVVANDHDYMGEHVNGWFANTLGTIYLIIICAAAAAAIPLMIITKAGQ